MPCVKAHAEILAEYLVPAPVPVPKHLADLFRIGKPRRAVLPAEYIVPLARIVHDNEDQKRPHEKAHEFDRVLVKIIPQRIGTDLRKTVQEHL